jgi:hypothetical protein
MKYTVAILSLPAIAHPLVLASKTLAQGIGDVGRTVGNDVITGKELVTGKTPVTGKELVTGKTVVTGKTKNTSTGKDQDDNGNKGTRANGGTPGSLHDHKRTRSRLENKG